MMVTEKWLQKLVDELKGESQFSVPTDGKAGGIYCDILAEGCKSPLLQESVLLSFWSLLGRAYKWPRKKDCGN